MINSCRYVPLKERVPDYDDVTDKSSQINGTSQDRVLEKRFSPSPDSGEGEESHVNILLQKRALIEQPQRTHSGQDMMKIP
jgi:hypothetical protein